MVKDSSAASLPDRTALSPTQIADLLNFVLRSTHFKYNGALYEQQDGAPMGSPISAVIADLYMEAFEEQTLATAPKPPRKWKRYVDDTFTVMKQHNADNFRSHLNQQHPSIRFTMETENNNKAAFLDTLVTREPDGKLVTSVYRKPTHTDQYLAYDSHHPQSVKRGIVKCLHGRAKRIITKPSGTAQEIHSSRRQRLSSVLLTEGNQNQESNTREGNNRIQVYCSAAMHERSLGTPPPPPTVKRPIYQHSRMKN